MIDYEKLKIAHDILIKSKLYATIITGLGNDWRGRQFGYLHLTLLDKSREPLEFKEPLEFNSMDDLITKLRELTTPMPKYQVGDTVYYLFSPVMKILELTVESIISCDTNECISYRYETNNGIVDEGWLYSSKEALIEAQIKYWSSLKKEEISTCSDDVWMPYMADLSRIDINEAKEIFSTPGEIVASCETNINHSARHLEMVCEHNYDALINNDCFERYSSVASNTYYTNKSTNEQFCGCGIYADFPHTCKCIKCGNEKGMEKQDKCRHGITERNCYDCFERT